ncbi:YggS family pyridoxal phosphate-dependent enzyme [Streptomyces sp. H51]|uniref:YggS family pyridoxal phosphate-dependent enzyme n=1 Tax=Streptomyces sp. H51 TaxID=3111770 RepID=UPI002D79BC14|nr:YggS family pyridoxal phosphate-dependent enzyme [Streptomyces sp. H51]
MPAETTQRKDELARNLRRAERRVAAACEAAGRPPQEVTLIAVTKTRPAADVRLLAELGVRDVGENRDQEAAPKAALCAGLPLRWHFIGQLQTNKARSVVSYADSVHSVDRLRLVDALARAVAQSDRAHRPLGCLVQVALDVQQSGGRRGGAAPEEVEEIAAAIVEAPGLRLDGLMTVAPQDGPYMDRPRAAFERVAEIGARLRTLHPAATALSAGMTGDLEAAVAAGATHVRLGGAVLGERA